MTQELSIGGIKDQKAAVGTSNLLVTRLGFGGAPIGGLFSSVTDEQAELTIQTSWDKGIRYFDTAPHYGAGISEKRLGRFLANQPRGEFSISTKVGRLLIEGGHDNEGYFGEPALSRIFDYSSDGVLKSILESLERLGLDYIDLVYVHDPDDHYQQACEGAIPTLIRLRDEGVIKAVGVGMNQAEMLTNFVRGFDINCVLLAGRYTLLDQSGLVELLPLCVNRSVSVIVGGVFNSGLLANPAHDAHFNYQLVTPEVLSRARQIDVVCKKYGIDLPQAAIWFPFGHPAVTSVLVGMRTPREVNQAVDFLNGPPPPVGLWEELTERGLIDRSAPYPSSQSVRSVL